MKAEIADNKNGIAKNPECTFNLQVVFLLM